MSLNIILIDDHTLFREGLVGLLSRRHINVLAAVGTGLPRFRRKQGDRTGQRVPGIEFRGVIDRMFKDPETRLWSIIEWKSNAINEKGPNQVFFKTIMICSLPFTNMLSKKY